jgi:cysteine desulfurase
VTRIYLDHNATSLLRPEARSTMIAAFDCAGNASSIHADGRAARALVEEARERVAGAFGVQPSAVYFTSSGTESANWLLQAQAGRRLVVSGVEHPCVRSGHRFEPDSVSSVPVSADGILDLNAFEAALSPGTFAAVQAANNETGVIQPLNDIARIAHAKGAVFVCDAVQAIGRVPLSDLEKADVLFFSAHKFGGPKGAGAAVIRDGAYPLQPLLKGGGQERRQRSGTENIPAIAGLAAALDAAILAQGRFAREARSFQEKLEAGIRAIAPDAVIFGEGARRLPNTVCFAIPGKSAETSLIAFDLEGISVSSGSACSSGKVERSHVLDAMGAAPELGACAIRVSTGWTTAQPDIERFLTVLAKICSGRQVRHAA